jgi:hypothetical protein
MAISGWFHCTSCRSTFTHVQALNRHLRHHRCKERNDCQREHTHLTIFKEFYSRQDCLLWLETEEYDTIFSVRNSRPDYTLWKCATNPRTADLSLERSHSDHGMGKKFTKKRQELRCNAIYEKGATVHLQDPNKSLHFQLLFLRPLWLHSPWSCCQHNTKTDLQSYKELHPTPVARRCSQRTDIEKVLSNKSSWAWP